MYNALLEARWPTPTQQLSWQQEAVRVSASHAGKEPSLRHRSCFLSIPCRKYNSRRVPKSQPCPRCLTGEQETRSVHLNYLGVFDTVKVLRRGLPVCFKLQSLSPDYAPCYGVRLSKLHASLVVCPRGQFYQRSKSGSSPFIRNRHGRRPGSRNYDGTRYEPQNSRLGRPR